MATAPMPKTPALEKFYKTVAGRANANPTKKEGFSTFQFCELRKNLVGETVAHPLITLTC